MAEQTQYRRVGDRRRVLRAVLKQVNESGVLAAIDLTGLTVTFKMINAATGATKIAATSTGVTVVDADDGIVTYAFSAAGVDEAGIFYCTFIVTEGSTAESVPVRHDELRVVIDSDATSGEQAYQAAVEAL